MTDNEIRQSMQHKREKDAMENALYMHERALSSYGLADLKALAVEQGLTVKGRGKAIYVKALVEAQRAYLEASK
jgi:hypothetical protein